MPQDKASQTPKTNSLMKHLCTSALLAAAALPALAAADGAPAGVTKVKFAHDYDGAPTLKVTFNAPDETAGGGELSSIASIRVLRGETEVKTFDAPAPGASISFTDNCPERGGYTYTFIATNAEGDGEEVSEYAWAGVDYAAVPGNVKLREGDTPGTVVISWDAPATYQEGSPINPALVKYEILAADGQTSLAAGIEGTSYTLTVCDPGERALCNYFVFSSTERGVDYSRYSMTPLLAVGAAYQLPYSETFAGGEASTVCGGLNDFLRGTWSVAGTSDTPAATPFDNDSGMAVWKQRKAGNETHWYSGKVAMGSSDAGSFTFRYYAVEGSTTQLTPFIYCEGEMAYQQPFTLGDAGATGWQTLTVPFSGYAGKSVQCGVKVVASDKKTKTLLDCIDITAADTEGGLRISALNVPARVNAGEIVPIEISLMNADAENSYSGYVTIQTGGNLFSDNVPFTVAAGEVFTCTKEVRATSSYGDSMAVCVAVTAEGLDEPLEESCTVAIMRRGYPMPLYPTYSDAQGGCILKWTAPDFAGVSRSEAVTDDVEGYEPFAIDQAGRWKFVDVDLVEETYSFTDFQFPNMGKPMAFIVFDSEGMNSTFAAHSGSKYFASFSSPYGANDNWMISEDLPGTAQTVSFYARSYSTSDPESFEVSYSTATDSVEDFESLASVSGVPAAWTQYSYDLPAGANYFAIRSTSDDKFFIEIDDISYTAGIGNLQLTGYEVYVDGTLAATLPADALQCALTHDADADPAQQTVQMKAVYTRGASDLTDPAAFTPSVGVDGIASDAVRISAQGGTLTVSGVAGIPVSVYTVSGQTVYSGVTAQGGISLTLPGGIYIVRAAGTARKVVL